ncbi:50S ribosomal protein L15 [bacterium]|nr:50S ribosomal protein L15 [bacterium]
MFNLEDRVSITKKRKRIGRGGSRGGTSGKGTKGQKARSGAPSFIGFEGGQMPIHRRLPKRGFNNTQFQKEVFIITLATLEKHFEAGSTVDRDVLIEKGILKKRDVLLKVLKNGTLTKRLVVTVDACSSTALQIITSCGGAVHLTKGA